MRSLLIFVCLSVCLAGCRASDSGQETLKAGKKNQKYNLEYVFHTIEVTTGNRAIDGVSIRDITSGEQVRFEPLDKQSLLLGDGYSKNVSWSPDEEYLILPLGQFEGFCILKSSQAIQSIRDKKYLDVIRIELKTGLQMSHEFVSWDGNSAFVFKSGMESSFPQFKYDVISRELTALERINDIFDGYNSTGKLVIRSN